MKTYIILILLHLSFAAFAGEEISWNQKDYPEMFYLFRNHGDQFGTPEEMKKSQQKSYESVKSMLEEAKTYGVKFITPVFFRLSLKEGKVLEGGLQLEGKRTSELEKVTRIRSAGRFLTAEYSGKSAGVNLIFKSLPEKLRELSLTLSNEEAYLYKTTGVNKRPDSFLVLFPLRTK